MKIFKLTLIFLISLLVLQSVFGVCVCSSQEISFNVDTEGKDLGFNIDLDITSVESVEGLTIISFNAPCEVGNYTLVMDVYYRNSVERYKHGFSTERCGVSGILAGASSEMGNYLGYWPEVIGVIILISVLFAIFIIIRFILRRVLKPKKNGNGKKNNKKNNKEKKKPVKNNISKKSIVELEGYNFFSDRKPLILKLIAVIAIALILVGFFFYFQWFADFVYVYKYYIIAGIVVAVIIIFILEKFGKKK